MKGATSGEKKSLNQWHCTIDQMVVVLVSECDPQMGEDPSCPQPALPLYMKSLLKASGVRF